MKRTALFVSVIAFLLCAILTGCGKKTEPGTTNTLEGTGTITAEPNMPEEDVPEDNSAEDNSAEDNSAEDNPVEDNSVEDNPMDQSTTGESADSENAGQDDNENLNGIKEKTAASVPVYCIAGMREVNCETLHIIDSDGVYAALSDEIEALNEVFVNDAYNTGTADAIRNICVRRADDRVLSFVREYREPDEESDYVQIRGYSFLTDSGKRLDLSDIVTDESAFYEMLENELRKNVMEDMVLLVGEADISDDSFDPAAALTECINDGRYGWVLDPQGITFWFEDVNALIGHASATVLFSADKEGVVFNEEFTKNVPDEWIMKIPDGYSSKAYFDCDDDGTMDSVSWYANSAYLYDEPVDSGLAIRYNGNYYDPSLICPPSETPWTYYSAYLMHKDKKTVFVLHHYEEIDSIWKSFAVKSDSIESVGTVYAYPESGLYTEIDVGKLVPTDMSAIRVYSDHGGDEITEYPDEILTITPDGNMKVSEIIP